MVPASASVPFFFLFFSSLPLSETWCPLQPCALLTFHPMSCPETWTDGSEGPRNLAGFVLVMKAPLTFLTAVPHRTPGWRSGAAHQDWPGHSRLWERVGFLSICCYPGCASGVRRVALLTEPCGVGEHATASPQAGTTGQAHQNGRNNQRYPRLGLCRPICTFVDCKHSVCRLVFFCVKWEFELPQAFFCALQTG